MSGQNKNKMKKKKRRKGKTTKDKKGPKKIQPWNSVDLNTRSSNHSPLPHHLTFHLGKNEIFSFIEFSTKTPIKFHILLFFYVLGGLLFQILMMLTNIHSHMKQYFCILNFIIFLYLFLICITIIDCRSSFANLTPVCASSR